MPLWIRALLLVNRFATRLFSAYESLRDELAIACVKPQLREVVTRDAYSTGSDYLPGGAIFEQGLFTWEKTLLDRPELPRRGRVLLGGAGGGRELKALLDLGYEICAFDPVERYCESCRRLLGSATGSQIVPASFDDLIEFARDGE